MSDVLCVWSFPPLLHTHLFSATVFIRLMILCLACLSYKTNFCINITVTITSLFLSCVTRSFSLI